MNESVRSDGVIVAWKAITLAFILIFRYWVRRLGLSDKDF